MYLIFFYNLFAGYLSLHTRLDFYARVKTGDARRKACRVSSKVCYFVLFFIQNRNA